MIRPPDLPEEDKRSTPTLIAVLEKHFFRLVVVPSRETQEDPSILCVAAEDPQKTLNQILPAKFTAIDHFLRVLIPSPEEDGSFLGVGQSTLGFDFWNEPVSRNQLEATGVAKIPSENKYPSRMAFQLGTEIASSPELLLYRETLKSVQHAKSKLAEATGVKNSATATERGEYVNPLSVPEFWSIWQGPVGGVSVSGLELSFAYMPFSRGDVGQQQKGAKQGSSSSSKGPMNKARSSEQGHVEGRSSSSSRGTSTPKTTGKNIPSLLGGRSSSSSSARLAEEEDEDLPLYSVAPAHGVWPFTHGIQHKDVRSLAIQGLDNLVAFLLTMSSEKHGSFGEGR